MSLAARPLCRYQDVPADDEDKSSADGPKACFLAAEQ